MRECTTCNIASQQTQYRLDFSRSNIHGHQPAPHSSVPRLACKASNFRLSLVQLVLLPLLVLRPSVVSPSFRVRCTLMVQCAPVDRGASTRLDSIRFVSIRFVSLPASCRAPCRRYDMRRRAHARRHRSRRCDTESPLRPVRFAKSTFVANPCPQR
jgi:hypothetical protein